MTSNTNQHNSTQHVLEEVATLRKNHVQEFLRSAGYVSSNLTEEDYSFFFYYLSRQEEFDTETKINNHNWELSLATTRRQELRYSPILEERAMILEREGKLTTSPSPQPRWPGNAPFAICLTHDVDLQHNILWRERLRMLTNLHDAPSWSIRAVCAASAARHCLAKVMHPKSSNKFSMEMWLEAEADCGFTSTFYFIPYPCPPHSFEDAFYRLDDKVQFDGCYITVSELMVELDKRGWDVGLHGSTHSWKSGESLLKQKKMLMDATGLEISSIRQHHLAFDIRTTPMAQAEAGLRVDTSICCNHGTGFRCGTSLPFRLYDLNAEQPLPLLEIPTTVQDVAVHRDMSDDEDLVIAHVLELMDRVESVGGVLSLLWHNDSEKDSSRFRTYCAILNEAKRRGAWGCNIAELEKWWLNQHIDKYRGGKNP